jgi:hypothetical protein
MVGPYTRGLTESEVLISAAACSRAMRNRMSPGGLLIGRAKEGGQLASA